jgi:hypothetical protein
MSADNWATCPRCFKDALHERRDREQAAKDAYGKVPEHEWLKMKEDAKVSLPFGDDLREDYEMYMEKDGTFKVVYKCSCSVCGFSFEYKHTERVAT